MLSYSLHILIIIIAAQMTNFPPKSKAIEEIKEKKISIFHNYLKVLRDILNDSNTFLEEGFRIHNT